MHWFYANAAQQIGPVTDADFENLVRAGTIQPTTMVWREGMSEWQPYAALSNAGASTCSVCGQQFAPDAVVIIGGATVCAQCKPLHLQRMREGAIIDPPPAHRFAGFWIRVLASIIDGVILFAAGIGIDLATGATLMESLGLSGSDEWTRRDSVMLAVNVVFDTIYEMVLVTIFGGTLGKLICGLRVVTPDGAHLSYGRSLARALAKYVSLLPCGIGFVMTAFDKEKRALHDLICNTRVVWGKQP